MSEMLQPEGGLMMKLTQALEMFGVGLLWVLCSLPVVTAGAAFCAAYYTMTKTVRGFRGYLIREYFRSFRDNFIQATVLWLLYAVSLAVISADLYLSLGMCQTTAAAYPKPVMIFRCLLFIALAICSVVTVYALAYTARFSQKTGTIIKNSVLMSLRHLPSSALILAILVFSAWVIAGIPLLVLVLAGVDCMIFSVVLERIFYRYMSDEDRAMEDRRRAG